MKLLLIGSTGGTGRQLLTQALAAGHTLTVIARNPGRLHLDGAKGINVVDGDVLEHGSWERQAEGHDVLLSCLGITDRRKPTRLYSEGTLNALNAMGAQPHRRLICLSSSGLEVPPGTPFGQKIVTKLLIQRLYRHGYDDMRRMEAAIHPLDIRWTIVRPPMLSNREQTGSYRTAINSHIASPKPIGRADLAHYILHAVDDTATWKATVEIAT